MCDVIRSPFRALKYMANGNRNSHGECRKLLSVVEKNRLVILVSILPVHKVVKCRA